MTAAASLHTTETPMPDLNQLVFSKRLLQTRSGRQRP